MTTYQYWQERQARGGAGSFEQFICAEFDKLANACGFEQTGDDENKIAGRLVEAVERATALDVNAPTVETSHGGIDPAFAPSIGVETVVVHPTDPDAGSPSNA